jgi:hypothetical protein
MIFQVPFYLVSVSGVLFVISAGLSGSFFHWRHVYSSGPFDGEYPYFGSMGIACDAYQFVCKNSRKNK